MNASQPGTKGRRGAGDCVWEQRKQSNLLQDSEETSLFRAHAIENADSDGPKELTGPCVRLVKAKGSLKRENFVIIYIF